MSMLCMTSETVSACQMPGKSLPQCHAAGRCSGHVGRCSGHVGRCSGHLIVYWSRDCLIDTKLPSHQNIKDKVLIYYRGIKFF